jgi:hypothetical protein
LGDLRLLFSVSICGLQKVFVRVSTSFFDFLSLEASFRRQNCDIKDFVRKKKKKKFVVLFPFVNRRLPSVITCDQRF